MISLTLRQLVYFQSLYETLHFGRAAEVAGVTQPALSAQIAEMEDRLGCLLFERGKRGVMPTGEAQAMKPRVDRILADMRDLEAHARRGRSPMAGRFRLGIIPTVAPYLLPSVLPRLDERFPALQLEIRESVTAALVEETLAGRLDGFVAAEPIDHPGLSTARLFEDRFFLGVAEGDPDFVEPPVPPGSPQLERLMLLEEGHCMRDQALAVCGSVRPAAMAGYGATSLTTLLQMAVHGLGVTLVPEIAIRAGALPASGLKIVPFREPMPSRTLCLAWRRSGARQVECRTLAAMLSDASGRGEMNGQPEPEHEIRQEPDQERRLSVTDSI